MGGQVLEYEAKTIYNNGIEEGWNKGARDTLFSLVTEGLLSVKTAAARVGLSEEAFSEEMKAYRERTESEKM